MVLFQISLCILRKWDVQFLYWIPYRVISLYAVIDLFTLSCRVINNNELVYHQIDNLEIKKDDEQAINWANKLVEKED
ncbi:hypothetical protein [Flavobacterium cellulosilyticum]|uniref:Uncharacterized protein n=1 Tax=Flavobacterium cellulosilyticum TaxID=2541731 RepID=A0A4R5C6P1_9FLAO|nr:hypothetical protein [Flavobacterium cellulosilyticum]TDD94735.1 hypothetical protein E0F76_16015 [Flavobacterium cellulosilyticum]